jgi:hypothetical protein
MSKVYVYLFVENNNILNKENKRSMKSKIHKILGIGLSTGLVFGLIGAIFAAPVSADLMEWGKVNTPSQEDYEILPGADIYDYTVGGDDGSIVYAVGEINPVSGMFTISGGTFDVTATSSPAVAVLTINATGTSSGLSGDYAGTATIGDWLSGLYGQLSFSATVTATTATLTGYIYVTGVFQEGLLAAVVATTPAPIMPGIACVNNWALEWNTGTVALTDGWLRQPKAWKSDDGGVTWTDITAKVNGASNLPGPFIQFQFGGVAVAPDDEEWLAVAGTIYTPSMPVACAVVASKDGGDNFTYTGDMNDGGGYSSMMQIYDVAVSIEVDDIHNIAVAGMNTLAVARGTVYRLKAGTWLSASWEDTSNTANYLGWDNGVTNLSEGVVAVAFSTNFDLDDTIVCISIDDSDSPVTGSAFLQSGVWESGTGAWNSSAGFPNAAKITADGDTLLTGVYLRSCGLALPADYDGSDPGARAVFLYVNAYNTTSWLVGGWVFRADNNSLSAVVGPPGDPLLASIAVSGDADTGKVMIGEYIRWENVSGPDPGYPVPFNDCEGVRVWHTKELDFCCPQWEGACKDPSGPYMALVMYTPDGEKAYATTSGVPDPEIIGHYSSWIAPYPPPLTPPTDADWFWGGLWDESAFSVSRDDGVSFNQLSLIDTDIDYLADVAVCPDCSTIYLSTVNVEFADDCFDACDGYWFKDVPDVPQSWLWIDGTEPYPICPVSECDSVWRSYDDGDTWERIYHGDWYDGPIPTERNPSSWEGWPMLRLPCDAIEDCCDQDPVSPSGTVYLGLYDTNDIFYSRDCGQCWNDPPATKIDIVDFAVESENIVYVLDHYGDFSMSTQYGRRWSDAVNTGLDSGHSIVACCEEGFIVVGPCNCGSDREVAWSDDGGDNWNLTDALPSTASGDVHVACDPVCENIVYAAVDWPGAGIYRTDLTDGAWDNLNAMAIDYTGIVVAREGTLYASSDEISANKLLPCATRFDSGSLYSGVARNLGPCETACCGTEDWDYLICGLGAGPAEYFDMWPNGALRICGCLTVDTNSILWAIDNVEYDVIDGSYGALWSYEDCAAKIGPTLTSPADGAVIDCEPCAGCDAANFTLKWERMCEACSYDIQIMDEDGNIIVEWVDEEIVGDPPTLFVDGTMDSTDKYFLECGMNYTWHVREANTLCECVHSPWSETWTFTVAVGAADAIQLLAPDEGAMGTPVENLGFSWTSVRNATSYSFVLSPNANLAGALVSQDMSTTAFNYVGPLDYSKAYYWQIIAWQDGTRLTTSSIGVFNTMAEPAAPTPPVVVEEQPAPVINIPPAEQITPTWIYAIIGIGCALAVVVIVLIVRTRRP